MIDPAALARTLDKAAAMAGQSGAGAVQPCARASHWVEVRIVGADGQGIAHQRYEIGLPDGTVHTGTTDADGLAAVRGFQAGEAPCTVCFPDLDQDAWELEA